MLRSNIVNLNDITKKMKSKGNYFCEYLIIKNAIRKLIVDYSNVNNTKNQKTYFHLCKKKQPELENHVSIIKSYCHKRCIN